MKDEHPRHKPHAEAPENHPSSFVPHPWSLSGDAIAFFDGRGVGLLVHYHTSPVGPYHEVARVSLTARGPKVVRMQVDSAASRRGGRRNWGFPKTLTSINWQRHGSRIEVRANGQLFRWRPAGLALPVCLRAFSVQRFRGRDVRIPLKVTGRARLAWRGRQIGLLLEDMTLVVRAAQ